MAHLALRGALQHSFPLVVATFCYSEPGDRPQFEKFEAIAQHDGGKLLPVFLHCSEDEIARRIGNLDRAERRKLTSMAGLNRIDSALTITTRQCHGLTALGWILRRGRRTRPRRKSFDTLASTPSHRLRCGQSAIPTICGSGVLTRGRHRTPSVEGRLLE